MVGEEKFLFLLGPGLLVDWWAQVVVPPLAALFACSFLDAYEVAQFVCNLGPILDAIFFD